jgi:hypothetical protein
LILPGALAARGTGLSLGDTLLIVRIPVPVLDAGYSREEPIKAPLERR